MISKEGKTKNKSEERKKESKKKKKKKMTPYTPDCCKDLVFSNVYIRVYSSWKQPCREQMSNCSTCL
jgi:hypothetical protein